MQILPLLESGRGTSRTQAARAESWRESLSLSLLLQIGNFKYVNRLLDRGRCVGALTLPIGMSGVVRMRTLFQRIRSCP